MDTKEYPTNYPEDAVRILDSMSLDGGRGVEVVGSASLRTQLYAGDYDANDSVSGTLDELVDLFKKMIRRLMGTKDVFIGDIKSGAIEEWRVIPLEARVRNGKIIHYDAEKARAKVDELFRQKVITLKEKEEALSLLKPSPSVEEFVIAKKSIKFHTQRWTIEEILKGHKTLKNGSDYTLQDAFTSHGITKVDVVGWIQNNRYTDFSMIYFFYSHSGRAFNHTPVHFDDEVKEEIIYYKHEGNYFKVLKREFSLAKFHNDEKKVKKLTEILNSDLGRMYHILGDIKTLRSLLEERDSVPLKDIRFEIDQFKNRFANIVLEPFVKAEHTLLGYLNSALKTSSQKLLGHTLGKIEEALGSILSKNSKKYVGGAISKELYEREFGRIGTQPEKVSSFELTRLLNQAYHFYESQGPIGLATAVGLRQLSNDIHKLQGNLDEEHRRALDRVEEIFLNKENRDKFDGEITPIGIDSLAEQIGDDLYDNPKNDYTIAKRARNNGLKLISNFPQLFEYKDGKVSYKGDHNLYDTLLDNRYVISDGGWGKAFLEGYTGTKFLKYIYNDYSPLVADEYRTYVLQNLRDVDTPKMPLISFKGKHILTDILPLGSHKRARYEKKINDYNALPVGDEARKNIDFLAY